MLNDFCGLMGIWDLELFISSIITGLQRHNQCDDGVDRSDINAENDEHSFFRLLHTLLYLFLFLCVFLRHFFQANLASRFFKQPLCRS